MKAIKKKKKKTHFGKGSLMEGLRIPTADDARKSAERLLKAFPAK